MHLHRVCLLHLEALLLMLLSFEKLENNNSINKHYVTKKLLNCIFKVSYIYILSLVNGIFSVMPLQTATLEQLKESRAR